MPTLIALCLPPVLVTLVALARGQERLDVSLVVVLAAALIGTVLIVAKHGAASARREPCTTLLVGRGFLGRDRTVLYGRLHLGQRAAVHEAARLREHYWSRYGATLLGLVRHHGVKAAHFLEQTHLHPGLEGHGCA